MISPAWFITSLLTVFLGFSLPYNPYLSAMAESFVLDILQAGVEHHLKTILIKQGYKYVFKVNIGEVEVVFEPDEEGHYRAVVYPDQDTKEFDKIKKELLGLICLELEAFSS
jgi:hypothetical protein